MTSWQKAIKYIAIAIAVLLIVNIFSGIVFVMSSISVLFNGADDMIGEVQAYNVSDNITSLNLKIGACSLEIKTGDEFLVESNYKDLTVKESGDRLVISEKNRFWMDYPENLSLIIYIPECFVFEKADITTGAGRSTIDNLSVGKLKLSLGAGEVDISSLYVSDSTDIEGGVGQIKMTDSTVYDLDFDMGVGSVNFEGYIFGDSDIDCGIGQADITLFGSSNDYRIDVENGIGKISVDAEKDGKYYGNGSNEIDISGGIGEITVKFKENQ